MKTNLDAFARLIAIVIWADGEYDELEKDIVGEIAEAFELDAKAFETAVDKAVEEFAKMGEKEMDACLDKAAAGIAKEEAGPVFEAVLEMALADRVLTEDETNNILSISDALGLDRAKAVMLLCDMIKDEEDIEIVF